MNRYNIKNKISQTRLLLPTLLSQYHLTNIGDRSSNFWMGC
ncbi:MULTISPECIES: hypothetical protein [Nostocales]|uniref:Transposase n=1 Tax=Scytonema tolypothrichoides VB-61278_2 TaxID=3232314 RepID=A0ABW8WPK2_9CYAN|nr:hypothetical protein [Tolypothrix bouteillei]